MTQSYRRTAASQRNASADKLRNHWPLLAVIGVWVLANTIILFWPEDDADREVYESYVAIWRSVEGIRQSGPTLDEWQAFSEQKLAEVQTIIDSLEDDAGAAEPAKQHLLWAGRDYLVPTLQGKGGVDRSKFYEHMNRARRHLRKQGFDVEEIAPAKEETPAAGDAVEL